MGRTFDEYLRRVRIWLNKLFSFEIYFVIFFVKYPPGRVYSVFIYNQSSLFNHKFGWCYICGYMGKSPLSFSLSKQ